MCRPVFLCGFVPSKDRILIDSMGLYILELDTNVVSLMKHREATAVSVLREDRFLWANQDGEIKLWEPALGSRTIAQSADRVTSTTCTFGLKGHRKLRRQPSDDSLSAART